MKRSAKFAQKQKITQKIFYLKLQKLNEALSQICAKAVNNAENILLKVTKTE